jgi:hypothetical protein
MADYLSPTGIAIVAQLVMTPGKCDILGIEANGEPEYAGGTEHFYDDQYVQTRRGKALFLDENGDKWTFDQLVKVEEPADDEVEVADV